MKVYQVGTIYMMVVWIEISDLKSAGTLLPRNKTIHNLKGLSKQFSFLSWLKKVDLMPINGFNFSNIYSNMPFNFLFLMKFFHFFFCNNRKFSSFEWRFCTFCWWKRSRRYVRTEWSYQMQQKNEIHTWPIN